MDEVVEDGVGDRRLAEGLMPVAARELAGDDRGATPMAVLDHLEQVGGLGRRERPEAQIVEDEPVDPGPGRDEVGQSTVVAAAGVFGSATGELGHRETEGPWATGCRAVAPR